LPAAQWVHFACHGLAYPNNPSANSLLLTDHQRQALSVVDVARLRLRDAALAFLSACETARTGITLADEAIQLASAFQLAGYQHVVATLWPINDRLAVAFAEGVYQALAASGNGPIDVAGAMHAATRRMRRRCGSDRPSAWASHIHAGT
jgi:CHAT domain-containing protein